LPVAPTCGVWPNMPKAQSRIVNGEPVVPHTRPYQVLLAGFFPNGTAKHYCGGSIITPTHILTAAHCVDGNAAANVYIYVGLHNFTTDILSPGKGLKVVKIFIHNTYSATSLNNDVAVLRLENAINIDLITTAMICLPPANAPVCGSGQPVAASGWGSTTGDPNRPPSSRPIQLQQVALACMLNTETKCKRFTYILGLFNQPAKMCAYGLYKGVCFGDSGGPLVRERVVDGTTYLEQVGIMSGTLDCSFTVDNPDVYANVIYLRNWIETQVKAPL